MPGKPKKKLEMITVALIPFAVAINFVGYFLASSLKLPMYLDSIGTFIVAATCGWLPGLITGILTGILEGVSYPPSMAYAINCAACGVVIGLLSKKGWMKKFLPALGVGLIVTFTSVLISTPITAYLFGGITETGNSVVTIALQAAGFGLIPAVIISTILTEALDKILVAIVAFFIIKAISDRFLSKLPLGHLYLKKSFAPSCSESEDDD